MINDKVKLSFEFCLFKCIQKRKISLCNKLIVGFYITLNLFKIK